jgi:hypothetical protein
MIQALAPVWTALLFGGGMLAYAACSLTLFKRQRAARKLEPPEKLVLLRGPGESLWERMEKLWEQLINLMFFGSGAALGIGLVPLLLVLPFPKANVLLLLGSGLMLFAAASIWIIRKMLWRAAINAVNRVWCEAR